MLASLSLLCQSITTKHPLQGIGIEEILRAIVNHIPPPEYTVGKPLRALIFDSKYDSYKVSVAGACTLQGQRPTQACVQRESVSENLPKMDQVLALRDVVRAQHCTSVHHLRILSWPGSDCVLPCGGWHDEGRRHSAPD